MEKIFLYFSLTTVFTYTVLTTVFFGSIASSSAEEGVEKESSLFKERAERVFKRLDVNTDNVITLDEFSARAEKRFKKMDADTDSVITLDELLAKAEKRFKKMDTDNDGKVTKLEIKSHIITRREKFKEHHQKFKNEG